MDDERLGRLEQNQLLMMQTLGRMESHLSDINGDLAAVKAEVGSSPDVGSRGDRQTLGFRLHRIENDGAAATAAKAALAAATESKRTAWSWKQKNVLFAFAALTALATVLRLLGIGG